MRLLFEKILIIDKGIQYVIFKNLFGTINRFFVIGNINCSLNILKSDIKKKLNRKIR